MAMGYQNYISEAEAASFAGVSSATLNRFVEAGYLQIESDSDGLRLFSKSELVDLFGLRDDETPHISTQAASPTPTNTDTGAGLQSSVERVQEEKPPPTTWATIEGHAEVVDAPAKATQPESAAIYKPASSQPLPSEIEAEPSKSSRAINTMEKEVSRLNHLNDLQEKLLERFEKEILDLKEQRDWLKSRVERLEEKSDRDQLLLLAETQTIRKLIASAEQQRRSKVRATLEWFGLLAPQNQPVQVPNPLEISRSK